MKLSKQNPKTNMITVTIPSENSHGIPVFKDFMAEAQRRFQVECDEKNKAYSFILSTGRLSEFSQFCISTKGINHHGNCVNYLELTISSSMEAFKNLLSEQLESVISTYSPYQNKLRDEEKQDLAGFKECLSILKKEK
jgi:hypothetical protein